MLKKTIALLAVFALAIAACSSTPSTEEATENLCASLSSLESTVSGASSIDGDTPVDDAESTLDSVETAWDDVKDDAEVVNETATQEAEDAIDSFKDAVNDLSGDASLDEAATQAVTAIEDLGSALASIAGSITCE